MWQRAFLYAWGTTIWQYTKKNHQCRYRNQIIKFWLKKDEFKNGQWFHNKMFIFHLTFWAFRPKLFECLQVKVWSPTHPTIIQYLPIFKIFETLWLFTVVVWVLADLILRNNLNLCKMRLDFRPQTQPSRGPNGLKVWSKKMERHFYVQESPKKYFHRSSTASIASIKNQLFL